ncbi:MAG: chemotaxis protein CheD [Sterolibacterium sp.]|nr:chemotaxis protein CheD [Sterolibacterium sp.]
MTTHRVATAAPHIVLAPGEFHFAAAPGLISTLLGSCVAITLWHPLRRLGGMCHILLPGRLPHAGAAAASPSQPMTLAGRYAEEAFMLFDTAIARYGCQAHEYQARLFGGGNMFPGMKTFNPIGEQNIEAAHRFITQRGMPLLEEHTGGTGRRKLLFDLESGAVRLQYIDPHAVQEQK